MTTRVLDRTNDKVIRSLARLFEALADPTRLRVVALLADRGEMTLDAIATATARSRTATTFHLARLTSARLITARPIGRANLYSLDPEGVETLVNALSASGPLRAIGQVIDVRVVAT